MKVWINGQEWEFDSPPTISEVLERLQAPKEGIAVEVNRQIVPRSRHSQYVLQEGDKLEVVHPVGGG